MDLSRLSEELKRTPLTAGFARQIDILKSRYGKGYEQVAEEILQLFERLGLDPVKTGRRYIYDYLKQLEYFIKNKDYGHGDFDHIKSRIYDDDATMMQTYLPGLLLSYAYTTILGAKNHFFLTQFLPRIDERMCGVEIGFGEGFYLWEVLKRYPGIKEMAGYDISPYSIRFASDLLRVAGIPTECYQLQYGDVIEGISRPDKSADFCICAELIEHIPGPRICMREIARILKQDGLLYLTTVTDSNHMDHISNFGSPQIVRTMLEEEGYEIIVEDIYYMTDDFPESQDVSVGSAFVAKRSQTMILF